MDKRLSHGNRQHDITRAAGYYCTNNSKTDYNQSAPKTAWDESSGKGHWKNRPDESQPFFAVFNYGATHESRYATEKALGDESASVRIAAARALARLGQPEKALPTRHLRYRFGLSLPGGAVNVPLSDSAVFRIEVRRCVRTFGCRSFV